MIETIMIGNLGADAKVVRNNGNEFVSFNVAHTDRYKNRAGQDVEDTMWVSVTMDGDGGKLVQYLTKGKCVCVRGRLRAKPDNNGGVWYQMSNPRLDLIGGGNGGNSANGANGNANAVANDPFAPGNDVAPY